MKPVLLVVSALGVLAAGPASASGAQEADPAHAKAGSATVDMEATLTAAQIDPRRADRTTTPGAAPSVTTVERALQAEGLLDEKWVDGHYGTRTVNSYAAYQRSLGYEGIAATGLPGKASLRLLGTDRFEITHPVTPGTRTSHGGERVNTRTKEMLMEAERRLDLGLELTQGSYNPGGDPTSAGTHDGGGVVDISVSGMNAKTRTEVVTQLRKVGFAAWHRKPSQGNWPHHIHAVAINDPDLSTPAQHQTGDYYLGKNGLANERPDDGPQVKKVTWEQYRRAH